MELPVADYGNFTKAFATDDSEQPVASFDALLQLAKELVDVKVFTVQTHDHATGAANRLYSTVPEIYPVGGLKPADETFWSRLVIDEQKTFVANNLTEIAAVFPDYGQIADLDCASIINIPVVIGGKVWGTLNCLHVEGHWTPERLAASEYLKLPGAVCFLLDRVSEAR